MSKVLPFPQPPQRDDGLDDAVLQVHELADSICCAVERMRQIAYDGDQAAAQTIRDSVDRSVASLEMMIDAIDATTTVVDPQRDSWFRKQLNAAREKVFIR